MGIRVFLEELFALIAGRPQNCQKVAFSVVAGPPKVALTPVELTPPWPPLEAWPQQKMQLFGNSEGLPAIRAKSSSQKTLIPISQKILEHPSVHT